MARVLPSWIGNYNVVDGPALRWLATQQEPRVWISDGVATGEGESQNDQITEDVRRVCTTARIKRVESLKDLLKRNKRK
jgi:hypothetical protein